MPDSEFYSVPLTYHGGHELWESDGRAGGGDYSALHFCNSLSFYVEISTFKELRLVVRDRPTDSCAKHELGIQEGGLWFVKRGSSGIDSRFVAFLCAAGAALGRQIVYLSFQQREHLGPWEECAFIRERCEQWRARYMELWRKR